MAGTSGSEGNAKGTQLKATTSASARRNAVLPFTMRTGAAPF